MSGKDNNKTTNKENVGKGGETSKSWHKGRGKQYAPQVQKQPGEVPILRFGQANSFYAFKEAISKAAVEQFGHDGKLFESNTLYVPPMLDPKDYSGITDPKISDLMYTEAVKAYTRKVNDGKMAAPKIYGYIWKYLSPESQDEVKHQADYVAFNADKDPEKLWAAIVKTHEVNSLSKIPEVLKRAARKEYQACRQGGYELLITYRERFDAAAKSYKDQKKCRHVGFRHSNGFL